MFSFLLWDTDHNYFSSRKTLQCFQFCYGTGIMTISLLGRRCRVFIFVVGR